MVLNSVLYMIQINVYGFQFGFAPGHVETAFLSAIILICPRTDLMQTPTMIVKDPNWSRTHLDPC